MGVQTLELQGRLQDQAKLHGVWAGEEGADGDREEDASLEFCFSPWITFFDLGWGWGVPRQAHLLGRLWSPLG